MQDREHALDMVVVGLGKGGGRIAGELCRRGYRTLVFHSTRRGLEEQEHVPDHARFTLGDERGTGGDPAMGRRLIRDEARRLEDLVAAEARDADLILICAGLGGGTGSAAAELVSVLDRSVAPIVVMATLPTDGETVDRKLAALHAARELTRAQLDGLIFLDDARLSEAEPDASILEIHARMNERLVEPLDALNRLPGDASLRAVHGLDANRLSSVLTSGGVVVYGASELRDLTAEEVGRAVLEELCSSWIVPPGLEPLTVSGMQIVIEAPEDALASTPARLVEHLREHWRSETGGASVDVSVYSSRADATTVRMIASCAALPARIEQLVQETAAEAKAARDKETRAPELDLSVLDHLDGVTLDREPRERKRRTSEVAPKPSARRPFDSKTPASEPTPLERMSPLPEPLAEMKSPPEPEEPEGSSKASRAAYARLVTRYKSTSNDELRRAIARRLEQDRASADAKVRFLAVYAMAKIGVHIFDASLVAATEDESPQVREAAERALAVSSPTRRASVG